MHRLIFSRPPWVVPLSVSAPTRTWACVPIMVGFLGPTVVVVAVVVVGSDRALELVGSGHSSS